MVDIVKPDISSVWAEAGAVIAPSNEKIKLGWTSEVPPHQYENFVQNRQDEMLAYLNQKGVPEWRTGTEYFLGKSFVQDAGKIYKANKNSGGLLPNQKPSTDATNEYWEQATFSLSDLKQAVGTSTKDVMSQKATSDAIALKVDSARVKQVTGVSTTDIMSQKAVTDALTSVSIPVLQTTGTSTTSAMSQNATTQLKETALGKMGQTHTANATFTAIDNKIVMAGIVTALQLEVGDVIQFSNANANNNKSRTVESITNDNEIIVNYEHCGSRGNGSLKLTDETKAGATVKLLAKWFNVPLGLGQAWQDVTSSRSLGTTYTNTTGRAIEIAVQYQDVPVTAGAIFELGGLTRTTGDIQGGDNPYWYNVTVPNGVTYSVGGGVKIPAWWELR